MKAKVPEAVARALRELKEQLSHLYGERLQGVYLYGSYSRGDFAEGSDVDVAVILRGPVEVSREIDRMGQVASRLSLHYGVTISILPLSETWWRKRESPLLRNLRREAVPVFPLAGEASRCTG